MAKLQHPDRGRNLMRMISQRRSDYRFHYSFETKAREAETTSGLGSEANCAGLFFLSCGFTSKFHKTLLPP